MWCCTLRTQPFFTPYDSLSRSKFVRAISTFFIQPTKERATTCLLQTSTRYSHAIQTTTQIMSPQHVFRELAPTWLVERPVIHRCRWGRGQSDWGRRPNPETPPPWPLARRGYQRPSPINDLRTQHASLPVSLNLMKPTRRNVSEIRAAPRRLFLCRAILYQLPVLYVLLEVKVSAPEPSSKVRWTFPSTSSMDRKSLYKHSGFKVSQMVARALLSGC